MATLQMDQVDVADFGDAAVMTDFVETNKLGLALRLEKDTSPRGDVDRKILLWQKTAT